MSEVSVFWTEEGPASKARIDLLKPFGMGDVKNIANTFDRPFDEVVHLEFARRRLDIQAVHYLAAWKHLKAAGAEGRVFGDCPFPLRHWHTRCCAEREVTFVDLHPIERCADHAHRRSADRLAGVRSRHCRREARQDTYRKCLAEYGLMKPWRDDAPVRPATVRPAITLVPA